MFQILEYITFLFKSSNQHGVHSPFVYDLVTQCFYDKTNYPDYQQLKAYRSSLLNNKQRIHITDFGSGSRVFKSNKRQVAHMAKTSGTTLKRAQLLYRLVRYFESNTSLELGTNLGIGTQAMALGSQQNQVTTIEGCPNTAALAEHYLKQFQTPNVTINMGTFEAVLQQLDHSVFDLIFVDGHHDKEATLSYFELLLNHVHNDSIVIFDDIHWSKDMVSAWECIKQHPKVSVTVDSFFWGFVFFRKEQAKENFIIRL
ncbi:MAG: class I SAM-dependent methyltransferase [Algicola sp.]|nr:class I SAM-dependent methyltransferase [Algicola sp.]